MAGALTTDATIGGTMDAPFVDVTAVSPSVAFAGDTFEDLEFRGRVEGEGVQVQWLGARQDAGRLDASGHYGFDRSFTAEARPHRDGVARRAGRATRNRACRSAASSSATARWTIRLVTAISRSSSPAASPATSSAAALLDLTLADRQARFDVQVPSLGASAKGTVGVAAPYEYRAEAAFNGLDLARLTPLLDAVPGSIAGQLSATATANGAFGSDAPPRVEANLQQLNAQVAGVPLSLVSPTAITWSPGRPHRARVRRHARHQHHPGARRLGGPRQLHLLRQLPR